MNETGVNETGYVPRPLDHAAKIYVAGHRGLVGSALCRALRARGLPEPITASSSRLDLRDREATFAFFAETTPDVVVLAAARVGGIGANNAQPVDFLSDNIRIQVNVLDAALHHRVPRLLFLGSSCIYPKYTPQPITEDALLTGRLEETNDAYAIAKITGILHVQAVRRQYGLPWISAMPTNLYGPNDNFSPATSHLLPALIGRYETARLTRAASVTNWGSGRPRRELLHVDDMAEACLTLLDRYDGSRQVNVGTGVDHTVAQIAQTVAESVGYTGEVHWDTATPDGTPRKLLDVSTLRRLGWQPRIDLRDGIDQVVAWYRERSGDVRH